MRVVVCSLLPAVQHENRATIGSAAVEKVDGSVVEVAPRVDLGAAVMECWEIPPGTCWQFDCGVLTVDWVAG